MNNSQIKIGRSFVRWSVLTMISVSASVLLFGATAFAAAGDLAVHVAREADAGNLAGASVTADCPGGEAAFTLTDAGAGNYTGTAAQMTTAGCTNTEAITYVVTLDGYVTKTDATNNYATASNPDTDSISGVQFSVKVSPTRESDVAALTGATVTAGSNPTSCIESVGVYYCAVPIDEDNGANDIIITKSGYVTNALYGTGNRVANDDAQSAIDASGVKFQVKIVVADELGNSATGNSVTIGGAVATESATTPGTYYFAQTGSNRAVVINKTGFINNASTNTALSNVSASAVAGQTVITLGDFDTRAAAVAAGSSVSIKGLQYTLKSGELFTEIGNAAITDIADGYDNDGAFASADLTLTGANGATINASAVSGDVIYIAASGNGAAGGADTVTVQLQNVTADGGSANDAKLIKVTLVDAANLINGAASQTTFGIGGGNDQAISDATGFLYPLKVVTADELGNSINASDLTAKTYDSAASYYSTSNNVYFANTGSNKTLVINKSGYVPNRTTNAGFADLSTNQTSQTVITLGNNGADAVAISAGDTPSVKGLQYVLKSAVLKSEKGVAQVSSIASGFDTDGTPSADVTVTVGGGAAIVATAVDGANTVYIAATGNGGGDDSFTVQVQNITVDGGNPDAASLVKASLTDSSNYINAGSAQKTFGIGEETGDIQSAQGFEYPLKVVATDELGNNINISQFSTATFGGVGANYTQAGTNVAYYGNLATTATLTFRRAGYVNLETNNTGLTDVSADQTAQTVLTMGDNAAKTTALAVGDNATARGVLFGQKITITSDVIGGDVTPDSVTAGQGGTSCTIVGNVAYCPVAFGSDGTADDIAVVKSGFVTNLTGDTGDRASNASDQASVSVNNFQYAQKITVTREGPGGALAGATVTAGSLNVACSEDGITGVYYCPVAFANDNGAGDISITKNGYVTNTSFGTGDRGANVDAQAEVSASGIKYGYKINSITSEALGVDLTTSVTGLSVGDNTGLDACTLAEDSAWYCPVVTTHSDGALVAQVTRDGYVQKSNYALTAALTRPADETAQRVDAVANVQYSKKITASLEATEAPLTGATVTAGSAFGTSCAESGAGVYYCAVPVDNDGGDGDVKIIKDGYVQNTSYSTGNRAAQSTAQNEISATGVKYAYKITAVNAQVTGNSLIASLSSLAVGDNTARDACTAVDNVYYCPVVLADSNGDTMEARVVKDGYVDLAAFYPLTLNTKRASNAADQVSTSVIDVQYSHKISISREQDDVALSGATVTAGASNAACTEDPENDGVYYCPVLVADDNAANNISITNTGYVNNTTGDTANRTANTEAQSEDSVAGVLFQLKVVVANELGTSETPDSITADGFAASLTGGQTYYFARALAGDTIAIHKSGYVDNEVTNAGLTNVTTSTGAQLVVTLDTSATHAAAIDAGEDSTESIKGLQYGLKVTVQRESDSTALTGATITVGDSYGVSCTENGGSGIHFCALPLAQTGVVAKIVKSGYTTKYLNYTDRTVASNPQGAITANLSIPLDGDSTAPTITAQSPLDNATSVSIAVAPTMTFSEAMDASTLNGATIQLRKYSDNSAVASSILYNSSSHVVTITPSANLAYSTQYYLFVNGATDAAGNTESTDYSAGTKATHEFTTASESATLAATRIDSVNTYATADATYGNGWKWVFNITVPTTETTFKMKFGDFVSGGNTISAANNIRFYSVQSSDSSTQDTATGITAAGTYSAAMTLASDLDAATAGRQIQVTVEMKVPVGSAGGSYSTSYGMQSVNPD